MQPVSMHRVSQALTLAGIFGGTAVALGAFGAHALSAKLSAQMAQVWQTAVNYQTAHALALLALGCLHGLLPASRPLIFATWAFSAGICLFSGSLYGLALGGPRLLGPITPLGGLLLLAGWGAVVWAGATARLGS